MAWTIFQHRSSYERGECKSSVHLTPTTIFYRCQQTVQLPPVPKPIQLKQTSSPKTEKKSLKGNYITTMYFVLCIVYCVVYCLFEWSDRLMWPSLWWSRCVFGAVTPSFRWPVWAVVPPAVGAHGHVMQQAIKFLFINRFSQFLLQKKSAISRL